MAITSFVCSTFTGPQEMIGILAVFLPLYGFLNGYIASVYYRFFKGSRWGKLSLTSALLYPLFLSLAYLMIAFFDRKVAANLIGGSGVSLMTLAYLWCFMNLPSTVIGALGGFLSDELKAPVKANRVRRVIPEQPFMLQQKLYMLILGFFTSLIIERQFSMLQGAVASSAVHQHTDTVWNFETEAPAWSGLVVFMEVLQVCFFFLALAESAVIHTHIQLCHENYNWWWNSFFVGVCPALLLFLG